MRNKSAVLKLIAGLCIPALFIFSDQASATITDLGTLTVPAHKVYGDSFMAPLAQFYDNYTFVIPSASVGAITATIDLGNFYGINNLQSSLYSGTIDPVTGKPSGLLQAWSTPVPVSNSGGIFTFSTITPTSLAAGSYTLEIRGDVVGTYGGSYFGLLSVSPVPDAAEWLLLLTGIGLLGYVGARRKLNKASEMSVMHWVI